ncbi:hypothetical protein N7493_010649 [Penicillium malachiteum]|uniref:2'-phosphotransferase n=1 Tax=Penicillium malachiteum TaxID=1324776 RepID=A0AAD6HDJ6_9EURO|nr:hypothetical protein N7493_010649 [Penicillium malachiteum]
MAGDRVRQNKDQNRGKGQSRDVQISKALSLLLRHAAEKEGLKLNAQGYASVADVLQWRKLKSIKCTFDEIKHAVDSSDKKRFALLHIPSSQPTASTSTATTIPGSHSVEGAESTEPDTSTSVLEAPSTAEEQTNTTQQALATTDANPANYLIRATQGHSIKTVDAASFLEPLSLDDESKLPDTVVHGTFHGAWPLILQSGGLKCMTRNHVHFATGPSLESVLAAQQEENKDAKQGAGERKVISGMRWDAQVLIYIDIRKALKAGCPFWRSENGVILSEGLPVFDASGDAGGNAQRVLPVEFFDVVVERKAKLGKIWEKGEVLQELPAHLRSKGNPKNRR